MCDFRPHLMQQVIPHCVENEKDRLQRVHWPRQAPWCSSTRIGDSCAKVMGPLPPPRVLAHDLHEVRRQFDVAQVYTTICRHPENHVHIVNDERFRFTRRPLRRPPPIFNYIVMSCHHAYYIINDSASVAPALRPPHLHSMTIHDDIPLGYK